MRSWSFTLFGILAMGLAACERVPPVVQEELPNNSLVREKVESALTTMVEPDRWKVSAISPYPPDDGDEWVQMYTVDQETPDDIEKQFAVAVHRLYGDGPPRTRIVFVAAHDVAIILHDGACAFELSYNFCSALTSVEWRQFSQAILKVAEVRANL